LIRQQTDFCSDPGAAFFRTRVVRLKQDAMGVMGD